MKRSRLGDWVWQPERGVRIILFDGRLRTPRRDPRKPQKPHGISGYEQAAARWRAEAPGPMGHAEQQARMKKLDRMFQEVFLPDIVDCIPPVSRFQKMLEDK